MFRTIGSRFSGTAVSPHKNIHCVLFNEKIINEYSFTPVEYPNHFWLNKPQSNNIQKAAYRKNYNNTHKSVNRKKSAHV